MHAEQAELADEGIHDDLEDVRDRVPPGVRLDRNALCRFTFAFQEGRRIAFRRVRHQARDRFEQFRDAGAGFRGHEAHGYQVPLAQRLLERVVKLLRLELLALLEIEGHQLVVHFDDLVDDLACGLPGPRRSRSPRRHYGKSSR